ncbi:MAG: hypothetical protein WD646_00660 [Actinomycetota bacterium]
MTQGRRAPETGVLVLGMHRSGTSAVARLVNLLGVPLSVPDDVTSRPALGNASGHWESAALRNFNDGLLRELGGDVLGPPELGPGWAQAVDPAVFERAQETFRSVYSTPVWVWKDPRNCITLPFWREVLAARPVCIVVHRNPLDVAASLKHRSEIAQALGLALWDRYTRDLLRNLSGLPVLVGPYDDLVDDPLQWCTELSSFLTANGIFLGPFPDEAVLRFVDAGLRSFRASPGAFDSDPLISVPLRDIHKLLADLQGPHESLPTPELPEPVGWMPALLAERRERAVAERRAEALRNRLTTPPPAKKIARRQAAQADELRRQARKAEVLEARLAQLHASRSFRYGRPLRVFAARARRLRTRR